MDYSNDRLLKIHTFRIYMIYHNYFNVNKYTYRLVHLLDLTNTLNDIKKTSE